MRCLLALKIEKKSGTPFQQKANVSEFAMNYFKILLY